MKSELINAADDLRQKVLSFDWFVSVCIGHKNGQESIFVYTENHNSNEWTFEKEYLGFPLVVLDYVQQHID